MTAPILPEVVLRLFQDEVTKIVACEIKKVCELYKLDYEEVSARINLQVTTTDVPGFKIVKVQKHPKLTDENRCLARIFKDLEVTQCSRRRTCGELCKKHSKNMKFGTINDPVPDELRPEVLNEKKKTTIYQLVSCKFELCMQAVLAQGKSHSWQCIVELAFVFDSAYNV